MTLFPTVYSYAGGAFGLPAVVDAPKAPDPDAKAKVARPLERAAFGASTNQYPGFDPAPAWDLGIAWLMRRYPTVQLAMAAVVGPIYAGTRTFEIRKDDGDEAPRGPIIGDRVTESPEDRVKGTLERHFDPLWADILSGLECVHWGFWTQEVVWERIAKGGKTLTLPTEFADFGVEDFSQLQWLHRNRRFAGFRYNQQERDARYALHFVHGHQINPLFGWPRSENARLDWWRALKSQENADRAERKVSGISILFLVDDNYAPVDSAGVRATWTAAVQTAFNALSSGGSATLPKSSFERDDIEKNPGLAEISPVKVDKFDWGSTAPAIEAAISRLNAQDTRIFRAYGHPEREAMEGQFGTKAEAGVHGQLGRLDCEKVHADLMRQFNKQTLNTCLVTNWGPKWKDRIFVKPTPLADDTKAFKEKIAELLVGNPEDEANQRLDRKRLIQQVELPDDPNYVKPPPPEEAPEDAAADPLAAYEPDEGELADELAGDDGDATPPANGNGRLAALGLSGGFDPSDHPKHPKGSPDGGKFAPKGGPARQAYREQHRSARVAARPERERLYRTTPHGRAPTPFDPERTLVDTHLTLGAGKVRQLAAAGVFKRINRKEAAGEPLTAFETHVALARAKREAAQSVRKGGGTAWVVWTGHGYHVAHPEDYAIAARPDWTKLTEYRLEGERGNRRVAVVPAAYGKGRPKGEPDLGLTP